MCGLEEPLAVTAGCADRAAPGASTTFHRSAAAATMSSSRLSAARRLQRLASSVRPHSTATEPLRAAARELITLAGRDVEVGAPPRTIVAGLNLTLREGDRLAILGENGSGKSITAQLLGRSMRGGDDAGPVASSAAIESAAAIEADAAAAYISFESHRRLLQDEEREFQQSRFDVSHKRATCASFLFPDLYPETADAQTRAWDAAQGRQRTRLAPLPVPYDATGAHPLLAPLEAAATSGYAGRLLAAFGLHEQRHRPLFALSTGEARKLMLIHCLLSPPQLLVLDEAFDGLDEPSRAELTAALTAALDDSLGAPAP